MADQQQPATDPQASQQGLSTLLVADLLAAWALLDVTDLRRSIPRLTAAVTALTHRYGQASATLAARQYRADRLAAGVRSRFTVPVAQPAPVSQVDSAVRWATSDLWDGATLADPTGPAATEAVATAQTKLEGAAQRLVQDAGRNTLIEAIEADRHARGYARVARPGACSFCLMLATRGAVYKSAESAGAVAASTRWADAKGELNRYHDHCHCTVQPLFADHYEPPAHIREAMALYKSSTKGLSGNAARIAFRQAVEGRTQPPRH